jgi:hypothetical protein
MLPDNITLPNSVAAYGSDHFNTVFSNELAALGLELPLQQGLTCGSYASADKLRVIILSTTENADRIEVDAGLFYTSTIPGCNCADDPTPDEEYS